MIVITMFMMVLIVDHRHSVVIAIISWSSKVISQLQFEHWPPHIEAVAEVDTPEVAQCMVADQHVRKQYGATAYDWINSIVEIEVIIIPILSLLVITFIIILIIYVTSGILINGLSFKVIICSISSCYDPKIIIYCCCMSLWKSSMQGFISSIN